MAVGQNDIPADVLAEARQNLRLDSDWLAVAVFAVISLPGIRIVDFVEGNFELVGALLPCVADVQRRHLFIDAHAAGSESLDRRIRVALDAEHSGLCKILPAQLRQGDLGGDRELLAAVPASLQPGIQGGEIDLLGECGVETRHDGPRVGDGARVDVGAIDFRRSHLVEKRLSRRRERVPL